MVNIFIHLFYKAYINWHIKIFINYIFLYFFQCTPPSPQRPGAAAHFILFRSISFEALNASARTRRVLNMNHALQVLSILIGPEEESRRQDTTIVHLCLFSPFFYFWPLFLSCSGKIRTRSRSIKYFSIWIPPEALCHIIPGAAEIFERHARLINIFNWSQGACNK